MPLGGLLPYDDEEETSPVFPEQGDLNDAPIFDADGDLTMDEMELMEALGLNFPQRRKVARATQDEEQPIGMAKALLGEDF